MTTDTIEKKEVITPKIEEPKTEATKDDVAKETKATEVAKETKAPAARKSVSRDNRSSMRPPRRRSSRNNRPRSEFDQVTIEVRRVARVMAGGRRFSFSVTIVIGDRKGRVGVGLGKGSDTALAVEKAARDARRHMITVNRTKSGSIAHTVTAKYTSSVVTIIPSEGRGIVAGSAMRTVLDIAGVSDVVAKIISRSKNKLTISRATVQALSTLGEPAKAVPATETKQDTTV